MQDFEAKLPLLGGIQGLTRNKKSGNIDKKSTKGDFIVLQLHMTIVHGKVKFMINPWIRK